MNNKLVLLTLSLFLSSCVINPWEIIEPGDARWSSVPNIGTAKNFVCTATLVGKDTLLTAAHCVDKKNTTGPAETVEVMFKIDDYFHVFICTMTAEYTSGAYVEKGFRSPFDLALCKALIPNRLPKRLVYENMDLTTKRTSETQFKFAGYGCYYEDDKLFGGDGRLRIGLSHIGEKINTERNYYDQYGYFRTLTNRNDRRGDICQGDSGGPTFDSNEAIIAVVSGGAGTGKDKQLSRFVDVSHPVNSGFIMDWLSSNQSAYICGVSDPIGTIQHRAAGCRTASR